MARTMLSDSKLPVNFWSEAVVAACYMLNRVLTVKKFDKTCFELLNCRKPNLKWLEPFGSTCTVLDPSGKFGPKSGEGFFVGYASPLRRVYIPSLHKIIQVQNVDCQRYTPTMQRPGDSRLFDYESLWESFKLPKEDVSEETLTMIYNLNYEEIIEAISPSTVIPEVCENNFQSEVLVPIEVVPRTVSYHPEENIIGDLNAGVQTRCQLDQNLQCFYSKVEPNTYKEALTEESWVNAMQKELMQFEKLGVWKLVDLPEDKKQINTKGVTEITSVLDTF
ncbi:uncharacterized protein LOC143621659 [Bidens hawaiensis]|uniref:uncharacterized protein LOC143621659 n=1 Tax=Bidens hawaiensis TaxID=980011 RepID=UPI004049CAEA